MAIILVDRLKQISSVCHYYPTILEWGSKCKNPRTTRPPIPPEFFICPISWSMESTCWQEFQPSSRQSQGGGFLHPNQVSVVGWRNGEIPLQACDFRKTQLSNAYTPVTTHT